MKTFLYWTPRVLTILFAAFISIFSFDVFDAGYTFGETLVALFMHLIPTILLVTLLVIAWRWERAGGWLFLGLALLFMVWFWGMNVFASVILPGIVGLVGLLFLADQAYRIRHSVQPPAKS